MNWCELERKSGRFILRSVWLWIERVILEDMEERVMVPIGNLVC